jgi:CheY-like chemotaxis protein
MADGVQRKWSVVVVDDDESFSMLVRLCLRRDGRFLVVAAGSSGADGIELAEGHLPDLIVLDDDMPDVTGVDAIAEIKRASPCSKVMVYTATASHQRRDVARTAGADAIVSKLDPITRVVEAAVELLAVAPSRTAGSR